MTDVHRVNLYSYRQFKSKLQMLDKERLKIAFILIYTAKILSLKCSVAKYPLGIVERPTLHPILAPSQYNFCPLISGARNSSGE